MNTFARISAGTLLLLALPAAFAFAQATPSASITSLSPGATVPVGNEVSFTVVASGFNSGLSYSVSDSLSGSTVSSSDINSSGVFAWVPAASDGGVHTITVTVSDQSGNSATATQQITVPSPTVSIQSLSPGATVNVGMTIFFSAAASGFTNPVYTVGDSFGSSSLTSSAINSSGGFSWTPAAQDVGSHTITVTVSDSVGDHATATQGITVNGPPAASIQSLSPSATTTPGQTITFTVVPSNFTNPLYSVSDSFSGSSVGNGNVNSSTGSFSWTPSYGDLGTHAITIHVSDTLGDSASVSQQITVQNASAAIQSLSPGNTVNVGTPVSFSVVPTGFTGPSFTLADSLSGTTVSNANIDGSGNFTWTPTSHDVGAHQITVYVSDAYNHSAGASVSITVTPGATATPSTGTPAATGTSAGGGYVYTMNLGIGSTGADVTALQNALTQQGLYSGPVTGYFGALTAAAVRAFQSAHGISPLGSVGPFTRAALNGGSGGTPAPAGTPAQASGNGYAFNNALGIGSTGTDVTQLQTRLTAEGLYSGPVTGYFGTLTAAAVRAFQSAHGISPLGSVGPLTRAALNSGL